jgi:hypothetical protein
MLRYFRSNKEQEPVIHEEPPAPSADELAIQRIRLSGLFDTEWYLQTNADLRDANVDPLEHYYFQGWKEGRNPSYLFESAWYLATNPDVAHSGMHPLLHYLQYGESEGRRPSPYFCPVFYQKQSEVTARAGTMLAAYLADEWKSFSPNEYFDSGFYLSLNEDVSSAGAPPLRHYIQQGWREGREINPNLSFVTYRTVLASRNVAATEPLRHFLEVGVKEGDVVPAMTASEADKPPVTLLAELEKNHNHGPQFEEKLIGNDAAGLAAKARLFAFYLPQFYAFPENNAWWGNGFTEWRNVTRAVPRFEGHQQPQMPRDLGFYDLRNVETMREQVRMARVSGVAGFCFYYYWFNGTRLLDRPLDMLLENKDIDIAFSLMWANENWTRRWDGLEHDVLMGQDYRESDDEALVADLARYFGDERYERVEGRPLFKIYRPGIIPNFATRLERWRELFRTRHNMDPLVLMVLGFGDNDPAIYGVDGAIEFPPHKIAAGLPLANPQLNLIDPEFSGHYFRYDDLVTSSLAVPAPAYDLIRTLVPAWDNEARKPSRGMGFIGSTPEKYENWLRQLVGFAQERPFRGKTPYVFVNAWNEWAEGAHLEPDLYHGVAYLNATYRALTGIRKVQEPGKNVLLVGHDAYLHGAQLLMLNIMRTLRRDFGMTPTLVLLEGGPLVERYRELGKVVVLSESAGSPDALLDELLSGFPARTAICNTVVTGEMTRRLSDRGFTVVSLIHELSQLITERGLQDHAQAVASHAQKVIFASAFVQASFEKIAGELGDKALVQPQGIYQQVAYAPERRIELREKLGVPEEAKIVLNMGFGDLRKGFDLFTNVAKQVIGEDADCHFVWLGNVQADLKHWLQIDLLEAPLASHFHVLPFDDDVSSYLNGADVYALTSREDPFPSVVLEALACGVPVVAFSGGGGYGEAIEREPGNGTLVPMADVGAMAKAILAFLATGDLAAAERRAVKAHKTYDWRAYVFGLLQQLTPGLEKVSVVVPNFNYATHLPERLASIFNQDYPIYELLILDDCSSDHSVAVIQELLTAAGRNANLVLNTENSGSVFKQWEKGTALAKGDTLWIAEADDSCTSDFLRDLTGALNEHTKVAFCDSCQVDSDGKKLGDSYVFYFKDLPGNPMDDSFSMAGPEFVRTTLAIKNVIMNVSSVLFDRTALLELFDEHGETVRSFKVAGDWFIYTTLLSHPDVQVAYLHKSNNTHRRHAASVTHALARQRHLDEIAHLQRIAADRVEVPAEISAAAAKYLRDVTGQLESREKN